MLRPLAFLFVLVLCGCASVEEARTLGRYDFSYRIEGDARAAPLQVFDDGRQTYLQFRDVVPGIFAVDREGRPVLLTTRREGQHVIAERVEREFVFLLDQHQKRASARYVGKQNRSVLPHELPSPIAPEPPRVEPLSEKIPFAKGSKKLGEDARRLLDGLLPAAKAAPRIAILERPARERKDRGVGQARALAVRDWLVSRGLDADGILIVKGSAVAPDYCEVLVAPSGTTKAPEMPAVPVVDQVEKTAPAAYGAAVPTRVSFPAQPLFVDRGRATATPAGGRAQ